ncbi:MAG: hypothetical protein ACAI35_16045 [Candidatus Methylacidiphilales bacterium]|nr:hypothetical protein [Candidatus Methylacidiphilales bacterium]
MSTAAKQRQRDAGPCMGDGVRRYTIRRLAGGRTRKICGHARAFSLVEVVLALGIFAFVLVALAGLLGIGLQTSRDSEDQIQAANLASLLISTRTASPTHSITNFAIPAAAMTNLYGDVYLGAASYVGFDGKLTNAPNAAYQITCRAGTNTATGSRMTQVYLMLSWPAQLNPADGNAKRYELLTYIPLR